MSAASQLAPHVDRLALSVHAGMRRRRDEVFPRLEEIGLASPALLNDLRPLLLAGTATLAVANEFGRFIDPASVAALLRGWTEANAVDVDGDRLIAAPRTIGFLLWTTDGQEAIVEELWTGPDIALERLEQELQQVNSTVDDSSLMLFNALRTVRPKDRGRPYRVHHLITELRYLRSDRHVAELRKRGIALAAAKRFDEISGGRSGEPWIESSSSDLLRIGWLDASGSATPRGAAERAAIDDAVDEAMERTLDAGRDSLQIIRDALESLPYLGFE